MSGTLLRIFLWGCFLFLSVAQLSAQLENTRWIFGQPSLEIFFNPFNGFQPSVHSPYPYNPYTSEGCAVAIDNVTGEMLFYTDGQTLYNRNHQPMPNGSGLTAWPSAGQAVSLAPVPGSCNRFYVFVVHGNFFTATLRWSIVNMDLENGLGDVEAATKSTFLHDKSKEGNIVIQKPGLDEYWLVTVQDSFYLVHSISASGITLSGQYLYGGAVAVNMFNISYSPEAGKLVGCDRGVRISDFDANTGVVSNPYSIYTSDVFYDSEFSPDGSKLYFANEPGTLRQLDFTTGVITDIQNQYVSTSPSGGGLKLGPDGKIYFILNHTLPYLSVINNPNNAGTACNFIQVGLNLGRPMGCFNFPNILGATINKITSTIQQSNNACDSFTAIVTPTNGQAPYTYEWSNGTMGDTLRNVAQGMYMVTTTDNLGCKTKDTVDVSVGQFFIYPWVTPIPCDGLGTASADLQPQGGTPPYQAVWFDGNTSVNRYGLLAGSYGVTVSDGGGCSVTATVTIPQHSPLALQATHTDATCGNANGNITLTVSGGQPAYNFNWADNVQTQNRTGLASGTYTVTVMDANQCTVSLSIVIGQQPSHIVNTVANNVTCFGGNDGSIVTAVSGGTLPYDYLWGDGETTQGISGLASGTYSVTVTDGNGCTASTSTVITEPTAITITENHADATCGAANGTITLSVSGGQPGYSFNWADNVYTQDRTGLAAGAYTVTVTDGNGCTESLSVNIGQQNGITVGATANNITCFGGNDGSIATTVSGGTLPYGYLWSDGVITADRTGLAAGLFTVTVTEGNGCTASATVVIAEPALITITETHTDATCGAANGTITLSVSGGQPGYAFTWADNVYTQDRTGLAAGAYTVTVTDAGQCTTTLAINIGQQNGITVGATANNVTCFGGNDGSIATAVSGGTLPYSYLWSDGTITADRTGLAAGTYTLTVTDGNSCNASTSMVITEPTAIAITEAHADATCGNANGTITLSVSGGQGGYSFAWADNVFTQNRTGLASGNYTVTVTDAAQCTATLSVNIGQQNGTTVSATANNVTCFGGSDGSITTTVSGGTLPYTFSWSNGETTQGISGLASDTYTVTVTDDNGCDTTVSISVNEPDPISVDILAIDTLRFGQTHTFQTTVQTNPGSISYDWTPSEGLSCTDCPTPVVTAQQDTRYALTIENNGCQATDTAWVWVTKEKALYIPNAFSPNNDGTNDVLYVYAQGVRRVEWSVLDRWGEVVFTTSDINTGWDGTMKGKPLPPGVFVIKVYIEFTDLTARREAQSVVLLR